MLTVGEILKKEREKRGYSLSQIEKSIKVREKFLKAVEDNNWRLLSSKIYIVGIVKNYARFLQIPPEKAIAFFYRDYEKIEEISFKKKLSSRYLNPETKKLFFIIICIIFGIFFIYFGLQLKAYFSPPKLIITSPKTTTFKKGNAVKISGITEKDAIITVAGQRIYQNEDGLFEFNHPLDPGKNMVIIEAVGANGRKTILKKELFRQGNTN